MDKQELITTIAMVSDHGFEKDSEESKKYQNEQEYLEHCLDTYVNNEKKRVLADSENFRKRMQINVKDMLNSQKMDMLSDMLDVLDIWDKFGDSIRKGSHNLFKDYNVLNTKMCDFIKKSELEEIECIRFDSDVHQAISLGDSEMKKGDIITVVKKGYRIGEQIIRTPLVIVQK